MTFLSAAALRPRLSSIRVLDIRPSAADFAAGHVEGALHVTLDQDLSTVCDPDFDPAQGGRHPLPPVDRFAKRLGAWGITPDTEVVAYDANGGGNSAARLWWMLRALGHQRVSVLDGGLPAAVAAGLPVTNEPGQAEPAAPYPADRWCLPLVEADTVAALHLDPTYKLLDVRAARRWRGEVEPLDPIAGRIPGSVNMDWADNLRPDGQLKSPEALRAHYLNLLAGVPPDRLVVHCGSGGTAPLTLLALESIGLTGAAFYVGGWSEWCRSGRPQTVSKP
jgi:thiosulfate/3-mercaptopyruvate sulfurtransferase